jgi:flagellar biogenesis protein FliO
MMGLLRAVFGAIVLCTALCTVLAAAGPAHATDAPASVPHGAIPFKQDKQGGDTLAYQSLAGLLLAGLAAYGVILGLKHFGPLRGAAMRKNRRLQIIESMRLSRRSVLHVVNYHGEELLLAEGEHGLGLVARRAEGVSANDAGVPHA